MDTQFWPYWSRTGDRMDSDRAFNKKKGTRRGISEIYLAQKMGKSLSARIPNLRNRALKEQKKSGNFRSCGGRYWTRTSDLTDVNREAHFCCHRSPGYHVEAIRVNGGLRNRGDGGRGFRILLKQPALVLSRRTHSLNGRIRTRNLLSSTTIKAPVSSKGPYSCKAETTRFSR